MRHTKTYNANKLVDLSGQIERITYSNEDNGFTIAKVQVPGRHALVTVVGSFAAPSPGEVLQMKGAWVQHPKYGEQFKVSEYKTKVPATAFGIRKYLGSGLIKGFGPVMAERIVEKFGENSLKVIEEDIDRLQEINGIGRKRIAMLKQAWNAQRDIQDVMLFLQTHGVSTAYAIKILKRYGDGAVQMVRKNPYRLATDIFGIGFLTADKIAGQIGFSKTSPLRAQAGVLYVLNQLADDGHVYYPYEPLIAKCAEILQVDGDIVITAIGHLERQRKIVIEDGIDAVAGFPENHKAVYLAKFYLAESRTATHIARLRQAPKTLRSIDPVKALNWLKEKLSISLAENQMAAVRGAIEHKLIIITGGPGTGKTTIINAILKIFTRMKVTSLLAAPTGRAAKRMSETSGHDAKTIHRLLEFSIQKGGFSRTEKKPLSCDVLIVDESSMIDTMLMYHLLKAVPSGATVILVGDVNQLPSVGAGNVLQDLIASDSVPVVWLNEIFRQARESQIIVNAHKINQGVIPPVASESFMERQKDFFFIQQVEPEKVLNIILELVKERIPKKFRLNPFSDIQVLTPMHRGIVGAGNLNTALQEVLNPGDGGLLRGDRFFKVNDKVMQIRNNYEKDVYNGDIGRIHRIDSENQTLIISFDNRDITYDFHDMDEIVLAYATSVHKAQGSEYPAVVIPILTQHYLLLQRNLIYTAVTRGRKLVVMVGDRKALAIGVRNEKMQHRNTLLKHRLAGLKHR